MKFKIVIPARFDSNRLPGKPLADVAGRPLILRTADRARESGASEVIIATDDQRIAKVCSADDLKVVITGTHHQSGTDRIAEVAEILELDGQEIVVNLQGDEPCVDARNINQVAELVANTDADIGTLSTPVLNTHEFYDPNVVKVVTDKNGRALYFSRAPIPCDRDRQEDAGPGAQRHIGLYAYRVDSLKRFASAPACELEIMERLEQLRALWNGWQVYVSQAVCTPGRGVDTATDLEEVCRIFDISNNN